MVARDRMTKGGHVGTNLMRPAGPEKNLEKCEAVEMLERFPGGQGGSAGGEAGRHAGAVARVTRNGPGDHTAALHAAFDQREVDFLHLSRGELHSKIAVRLICPGHQENAAGEA